MNSSLDSTSSLSASCDIVGSATYPSLSIVDARSEGKSTSRLWQLLSISSINEAMSSDLTSAEKNLINFSGLWSHNTLIDRLKLFTFDFSAAPVGKESSTVYVMIENTGPIPFDWNIVSKYEL